MRILLILPFFYPHPGGSQKYAEDLSANLVRNHPEIAVDVLCYNSDQAASYEEYRGLHIYRIPCLTILPGKFLLPNPTALISKLRDLSKNHYDFVNTHIGFFDSLAWVWLYARAIKAKSIFTGHTASLASDQNPAINLIAKMTDFALGKLFLRFYDQIVVTSQATGEFYQRAFGIKNYQIVYGGVNLDLLKPGSKTQGILVSYVGRLIGMKGLNLFWLVVEELLNERPEGLRFVLAGEGELGEVFKKRIKEKNWQDKVFLPGRLNSGQVSALLAATDIFAYPSLREGFPQSILEAGASGCCVIATDTGGVGELIIDHQTGLLIPVNDKEALKKTLEETVSQPDLRTRLGRNLRNLIEGKFNWDKISARYYQFLINAR